MRTLATALTLLVMGSVPAASDWLVTETGERIETDGPWKVEGRRIVFRLPNGTLSSLRTSAVDLDASEAMTRKATEKPEEGRETKRAEKPKEPVLVLTDADVARVNLPPGEEPGAQADQEGQGEGSGASSGSIEITSWREVPDPAGNGLAILGSMRNGGQEFATAITVDVRLVDEAGNVVDTADAKISSTSLRPGQRTNFRAPFDQLHSYADVKFQVDARSYRTRTSQTVEEDGQRTSPDDDQD